MIEPCACAPCPVTSSREREPGAELVDVTDERGRWHAVRVGDVIYLQALVLESAAETAARVAHETAEAAKPKATDPLAALAQVATLGANAPADARAVVTALAARKVTP